MSLSMPASRRWESHFGPRVLFEHTLSLTINSFIVLVT